MTLEGDRVRFRTQPEVAVTRGGELLHRGRAAQRCGGGKVRCAGRRDDPADRAPPRRPLCRPRQGSAQPCADRIRGAALEIPIHEAWCIKARFESSKSASPLVMDTIVGTRESFEAPGHVGLGAGRARNTGWKPPARGTSSGLSSAVCHGRPDHFPQRPPAPGRPARPRRRRDPGFRPGRQPPLGLHALLHLPDPAPAKPPVPGHSRRRATLHVASGNRVGTAVDGNARAVHTRSLVSSPTAAGCSFRRPAGAVRGRATR